MISFSVTIILDMGRRRLLEGKLVPVNISLRPEILAVLENMTREVPCTLAAAVRRVIEASPIIKAALKKETQ